MGIMEIAGLRVLELRLPPSSKSTLSPSLARKAPSVETSHCGDAVQSDPLGSLSHGILRQVGVSRSRRGLTVTKKSADEVQ
jgi:hypothetical protein